jgi:hypothetical protein
MFCCFCKWGGGENASVKLDILHKTGCRTRFVAAKMGIFGKGKGRKTKRRRSCGAGDGSVKKVEFFMGFLLTFSKIGV